MTLIERGPAGLARIASELRAGEAVLLGFPSPLPYVVAATTAAAANRAKGRPRDQPCGMLVADAETIEPHLALDGDALALARWIALEERANLLVPVAPNAPPWLAAAASDGLVGITLACLADTRPLAEEFGLLFVSSGNATGGTVAVTAAEADAAFGGERLVLDCDAVRDTSRAHGSGTIIEVHGRDRLRVMRDDINNAGFGTDREAYLTDLLGRYAVA